MVARLEDGADVVLLLGVERLGEEEVGEADHGGQRGAELVAQPGEEFALGPVGGLRQVPGVAQLGLGLHRQLGHPHPVQGDGERGGVAGQPIGLLGVEGGGEGAGQDHQDALPGVHREGVDDGGVGTAPQPHQGGRGGEGQPRQELARLGVEDALGGEQLATRVGDQPGAAADQADRPVETAHRQCGPVGAVQEEVVDGVAEAVLLGPAPDPAQPPGWREPRVQRRDADQGTCLERDGEAVAADGEGHQDQGGHDHDPAIPGGDRAHPGALHRGEVDGEAGQPVRGLRHGQAPDHQEEVQRQLLLRTRCDAGAGRGRQVCHETERGGARQGEARQHQRPPRQGQHGVPVEDECSSRDHGGDHQHAGERRRVADERLDPGPERDQPQASQRDRQVAAPSLAAAPPVAKGQHADEQEGGRVDDLEDAQGEVAHGRKPCGRGTAGAAMTSRRPGGGLTRCNPPAFRVRWRAGDAREWRSRSRNRRERAPAGAPRGRRRGRRRARHPPARAGRPAA